MGSGFRTWSALEAQTASQVQNYLQDQVVMVFADSSARTTAISSPEEGMVTYLKDSDALFVYDGADWDQVFGLGGTVGTDGAGVDVTFYSATSGDYFLWDASEEKLILEGTHSATVLDVTDGNVVIADGTLTVGSAGAGEDVTFYSDTSGDQFVWDSSAEKLTITGTNATTALDVADGNVTISDTCTAGAFSGPLTGNVTGNASGSSGSCTGNAATATEATNVTAVANNSANETVYPTFVDGATGTQGIETDTGLTYNPSSGLLTAAAFSGPLTGAVTGNADTATEATNITAVANNSTAETVYPTFVDGATGTQGIETDTGLTYNPNTGLLTSAGFSGPLTGNVTGNASGSSGSCTGLAATATALATGRTIGGTSFDGTANIAVALAATATALASARTIGGTSFDGTGNIVPATITVADTTDTSCSVALWESATGDLAPKSDGGLTYNAGTGTLTATAFAGPLTGNVTGNASGTALTVTQAAQSAITSVGTLTGLAVTGTVTLGVDDTGVDLICYGAATGAYMKWNQATDDLQLVGAAGLDIEGDIDVDGTTNLDAVDIDGNVDLDGEMVVGADTDGYDVQFFGNSSGAYLLWDESADQLHAYDSLVVAGNTTDALDMGLVGGVATIRGINVGASAYNDLEIRCQSGTHLYLNTSGFVGIGTATPSDKLHVADATTTVSGTQIWAEGKFGGYGAGISFASATSSGGTLKEMAKITGDGEAAWNTTASTQDAGLRFFATLDGTLAEKMRIQGGGNVGIGTGSPASFGGVNVEAYHTGIASFLVNTGTYTGQFYASSAGIIVGSRSNHGVIFSQNDTTRMTIAVGGVVNVVGEFTAGTKTFDIAHPTKGGDWRLRHASAEGPRHELIYRGTATLSGGTATVDLDTDSRMTDGTWEALCTNPWAMVASSGNAVEWSLSGKTLTITSDTADAVCSWMVIAERQDDHMKGDDCPSCDDDGHFITEYEREVIEYVPLEEIVHDEHILQEDDEETEAAAVAAEEAAE